MIWPWISELMILGGTECDGNHQPYFASTGSQEGYFLSKAVAGPYNDYTQLNTEKPILVEGSYEKLLNADCITFINHNLGSKRMYANIVKKEWVNTNTTKLYCKLNAFQTFMHDIKIDQCFVEREMQEDDWAGGVPTYNNLVPENIGLGPQVITATKTIDHSQCDIIVAYIADINGKLVGGTVSNQMYNGVQFKRAPISSAGEIDAFIKSYETYGKLDHIIAIFMCPRALLDNTGGGFIDQEKIESGALSGGIDGYQPQNAKCYAYPYHYCAVSNRSGTIKEYKFENYSGPQATQLFFVTQGAFSINPQCVLRPMDYKTGSFEEAMNYTLDAQCIWGSGGFANWYGQHGASLWAKGFITIGAGALALATGNPIAGVGAIGSAANLAASVTDASNTPYTPKGNPGGDVAAVQTRQIGFDIHRMTIRREDAERLDSYFDAYGYATNQTKSPNLRTRPFWNYIKTRDCHISGPLVSEWMKDIESLFNNGVTLWHVDAGAVMGDYSMDNRG